MSIRNEIYLEQIDWYLMSETIFTKNQCFQIINPLSLNLYCLSETAELKSKFSWSDSEIFTLIEEITSMHQYVFKNLNCLGFCLGSESL